MAHMLHGGVPSPYARLPMTPLEQTADWSSIRQHADRLRGRHLRALFEGDPDRALRYRAQACGLLLDYSKQRIDDDCLPALQALAISRGLSESIRKLFAGAVVNGTEQRAALHMALRAPRGYPMQAQGHEVGAEVHQVLDRMRQFSLRVREGQWLGARGGRITDVVNIGIGGSDLGPRMVCRALQPRGAANAMRAHFVANVDGAQLADVLSVLDPASTLFVITSKTFTTQETMANAAHARRWLVETLGADAVARHCVAVSTNLDAVAHFGIEPDNCFAFWDWVGGRYSVWSAVGLSAMLALGPECFDALLSGAHDMDRHFSEAEAEQNLPVLMALLSLWNVDAMGAPTQVVGPYAQRLEYFVAWLQQLEMESNGKGVMQDGTPLLRSTPALWGDVGTNAQHAFFQMLHQGPTPHPVDFIVAAKADHPYPDQHRLLLANVLAQAAALMRGKTADEVRAELTARGLSGATLEAAIPHRVFTGNRPSNLLVMPQLDAYHLGALMALYEHRTFVLSVLWGLNAFDQWGVELGKQLAQRLLGPDARHDASLDASTRAHLDLLD